MTGRADGDVRPPGGGLRGRMEGKRPRLPHKRRVGWVASPRRARLAMTGAG
ncbi:MAG: hypothetical protein FWF84_04695 [Kiritimatiellaeota bacterium]|nr:hypothetical protein [Kiritimatiellota bacterium]